MSAQERSALPVRPVVGVLRETAARERRVALDPGAVAELVRSGRTVLVQRGAGERAGWDDGAYAAAGASVGSRTEVVSGCDVVLCVGPPLAAELARGQLLVGLLGLLAEPRRAVALAQAGVDAVDLTLLPRTVSAAQTMDALTSQAAVAGYKAAVLAADAYGGFFPMLTTASGTVQPARVLVLGAGVAGMEAIATAARLGAVVSGYDVRPESRAEVESLGARFVVLAIPRARTAPETGGAAPLVAAGAGGYARALDAHEASAQQAALADVVAAHDVVIATAAVPGRRPPLLVTAGALARMRPGSVVVDLAAGPLGGNVERTGPRTSACTAHGVSVIGAGDLPSRMPRPASTAYGHNLTALLAHLERPRPAAPDSTDGPDLTRDDPVTAGVVVVRGGAVVHPAVRAALDAVEGDRPAAADTVSVAADTVPVAGGPREPEPVG